MRLRATIAFLLLIAVVHCTIGNTIFSNIRLAEDACTDCLAQFYLHTARDEIENRTTKVAVREKRLEKRLCSRFLQFGSS
jgi:hypothetical protein